MTKFVATLRQLIEDLNYKNARWALVGGLAVSLRAEPRTTRDIDLVIASESESEAEKLIFFLRQARAWEQVWCLDGNRQLTVRMINRRPEIKGTVVDFMIVSSGIEKEVVQRATEMEVEPGLVIKVASVASLLALKTLPDRPDRLKDETDFLSLARISSKNDLLEAIELLDLIQARGFDRNQNLRDKFYNLLAKLSFEFGHD
jgi:Nucleotidyl transferase AbiEii toxin, Type IV TA system